MPRDQKMGASVPLLVMSVFENFLRLLRRSVVALPPRWLLLDWQQLQARLQ
jgi:hypothetical protein